MPDARELFPDQEEAFRAAWAGVRSHMHTTLPVIVAEDSDGHTVKLQIAVKQQVSDKTYDNASYEAFPLLVDVPVHFASGGGHTFTHPVKKGDEGVVLISSRAIDAWHQSGGVQQPIFNRFHSLSDGVAFLPGIRSNPRKLSPAPSTNSAQLRSDDGKHFVDLHKTNGLTLSVDNGKHVTTIHPDDGISHTSQTAVNINAPQGTFTIPSLAMIGNFSLAQDGSAQGGNLHLDQDITVRSITATQSITAQTVNAPNGKVGS